MQSGFVLISSDTIRKKHPEWQEMLEEIEDKAALPDHITVDLERPINAFLLIWVSSYRPNQYISSNQELTDDIYRYTIQQMINCE